VAALHLSEFIGNGELGRLDAERRSLRTAIDHIDFGRAEACSRPLRGLDARERVLCLCCAIALRDLALLL
jgi:hypothetical protein